MVKDFRKRYNTFNDHHTDKITEDQFKDLTSHDLKRIKKVMAEHEEMGKRLRLKEEKQKQHIYGTKDYKDYKERIIREIEKGNSLPSYFAADTSSEDIYNFMLLNSNMNNIFRRYQLIDIGKLIGTDILIDGDFKNASQIKVMQSKRGIHGVPTSRKRK